MNKQQLIICKGLPASGKSTFSKAWVEQDSKNRIRVCRDDIRRMLGPYWIPTREDLVTTIEREIIEDALIQEYSVIVDATNFRCDGIKNIALDLNLANFDIEIKYEDFTNVSLEECIKRDSLRIGEECVGKDVIINMYNKYLRE
jgi:tRNA uridine 5-carbamoylmethylation protein Kti12